MKSLFLILVIITSNLLVVMAQTVGYPCDITSTGIELRNASGSAIVGQIPAGGSGLLRLKVVNAGSAIGSCSYLPGELNLRADFAAPTSLSYFYKYDGPLTFNSPKYAWTYNPATSVLKGVNTVPIVAGFGGFEVVDIPITGVAAGSFEMIFQVDFILSASSDLESNNSWPVNVTVVAPQSLPLILGDFSGTPDNCDALLKWTTSHESELASFEIEQSTDGVSFNKVGVLAAKNATNGASYQFVSPQSKGLNYYRLKMIDNNGQYVYSKIVSVQTSCNKKIVKLFPNPVITNQLLNVNISGYEKNIKAELYSVTGQLIKSYQVKNGSNTLTLDRIAQGTYTLKVTENGILTESFKVTVIQ
jgi:hypothetical protein